MELTDYKSAGILDNFVQCFNTYSVAKMQITMEHLKSIELLFQQ